MKHLDSFYVDPDVRCAETLHPSMFTDPTWLELEIERVFGRTWLFVPQRTAAESRDDPRELADLVRLRGSQAPFHLIDRPLFLQRDWKDRLAAFPNVCTHAWFPLVDGPGRVKKIACRQHGRQFECDGRFYSQPGFGGDLEDFPRPCDDLVRLPVVEWSRFLFVALGKPKMSEDEALGEVRSSVFGLPLDRLRPAGHGAEVREVPGNWKQHAWNFMDRFHIGYIHRAPGGLADAVRMESYRTELYPWSALQWVHARDPAAGFDPALLPERFAHPEHRVFALWWFVFPNLTLNFYPWGLSVNVYAPIPERPDRTLFHWYHYVLDEAKYARREELWLATQVDDEDVDAMAQVRRGIRSGYAVRGRFAAEEETGPHWFHRLVYEMVFEG